MSQNESKSLPGFFFYPSDKTDLVELSFEERCELLTNQGNYMVPLWQNDPVMRGDLECSLTNARIPTHKRHGAVIPGYGSVPFSLL